MISGDEATEFLKGGCVALVGFFVLSLIIGVGIGMVIVKVLL